jgi:hypothetical protein
METHCHQNYLAFLTVDGNFMLRRTRFVAYERLAIDGGDGQDGDKIPELVQMDD